MVPISLKIFLDDKMRSVTTISGVAFAVMLVYVQVGIFLGMLDHASVTIDRMEADLWVTARGTPNIDFASPFPETYVERVRSVPGIARADNLIVWFVAVSLPGGVKETALVYGLEDFGRWHYPWNVTAGSPSDLRRGRFAILDESAMARFGAFAVGDHREFLGLRLRIIGRSREARSFTTNPIAFVDYRVAQAMAPRELDGRTTYIVVKLAPGTDVDAVRSEIARRLPFNDVRTRAEWSTRSRRYWIVSTGLGLSMYVTVFVGSLFGAVIVGQTLHSSTIEHSHEYALVKALGGRDSGVYRIVSEQAALAAVAGFSLGSALAFLMRPVMDSLDLKMVLSTDVALDIAGGTLALCLAASVLSYRRIARLEPAMVFRA
jgi:putative ABC transport system permease protein